MTNPQGPNTAILTYFITAQQLYEMRTHLPLPLFISEGDPKVDPNRGWHAALSRLVSTVSVHGGSTRWMAANRFSLSFLTAHRAGCST